MLVLSARVLIKRGILDYKEVKFKFKEEFIYCDKNGRLSQWPEGFCDCYENYLIELLD